MEVREIHSVGNESISFRLSKYAMPLPREFIKRHEKCIVPLAIQIPLPEIDSQRGATGLPSLNIGNLTVQCVVRVTVPISTSRFGKRKKIRTESLIAVGNKRLRKDSESVPRNVPRLVVNSEEGGVDLPDSSSRDQDPDSNRPKEIVGWTEACEAPRFLHAEDVFEGKF